MRVKLVVEVELEHRSGVFVSKDEIAEELVSWIESADEGEVYVDDSEYEVVAWSVDPEGEV